MPFLSGEGRGGGVEEEVVEEVMEKDGRSGGRGGREGKKDEIVAGIGGISGEVEKGMEY